MYVVPHEDNPPTCFLMQICSLQTGCSRNGAQFWLDAGTLWTGTELSGPVMAKGAVGRPCHHFLPTQLQAVFWVCNKELWIHWGGERGQKGSQLLGLPQSPNVPPG